MHVSIIMPCRLRVCFLDETFKDRPRLMIAQPKFCRSCRYFNFQLKYILTMCVIAEFDDQGRKSGTSRKYEDVHKYLTDYSLQVESTSIPHAVFI